MKKPINIFHKNEEKKSSITEQIALKMHFGGDVDRQKRLFYPFHDTTKNGSAE